jgi:hypothetical protein
MGTRTNPGYLHMSNKKRGCRAALVALYIGYLFIIRPRPL